MKNQVLCDWLSFTIFDVSRETVLKFLHLNFGLVDYEKARFGYSRLCGVENESILVYDNPSRLDMGVHVSVGGSSMIYFLHHFSVSDDEFGALFDLFKSLSKFRYQVTRFDLALDDYVGSFDIYQIPDYIRDHHVNTPWKKFSQVSNIDKPGLTIYCGSRSSLTFLRIYDKMVENKEDSLHYRYEFECKDQSAKRIVDMILENKSLVSIIVGFFNQYFYISPIYNRDFADFLSSICDKGNYRKLDLKRLPSTIERQMRWLLLQ